jgi:vitamin K-dependent gamma-carboxylase
MWKSFRASLKSTRSLKSAKTLIRNASIPQATGKNDTVEWWLVAVLRIQITICYFFAGVSKINHDWLHGEPVRGAMLDAVDAGAPTFLANEWFISFLWISGLFFDLCIGFMLWFPRTKLAAFTLTLCFNASNAYLFPKIDLFPFFMLCANMLFIGEKQQIKIKTKNDNENAPFSIARLFALLFIALQIVLPLRHFVTVRDQQWSSLAPFFNWDMFYTQKDCTCSFVVEDALTGSSYLSVPGENHHIRMQHRQMLMLAEIPMFIKQYAVIEAQWATRYKNMESPQVFADCWQSLNSVSAFAFFIFFFFR